MNTENNPGNQSESRSIRINFPDGLIGLEHINEMLLVETEGEYPFAHLVDTSPDGLQFIIIDPFSVVQDYSIRLSDADTAALKTNHPDNILTFAVVNFSNDKSGTITANLLGPILINKNECIGKQVIPVNHESFSANHPIYKRERKAC